MKTIKQIAKEFFNEIDANENEAHKDNNSNSWKTYIAFTGFINGTYLSITFMEHKKLKSREIVLNQTCDAPEKWVRILKEIEPEQKITYSELTYNLKKV